MSDHHFGRVLGAYNFFKDKPSYDIGRKFPNHIVCIKTSDTFYPRYNKENCYEIVLLDTNRELVLFYGLCIETGNNCVVPLTWRIPDYKYDIILADLIDSFLEHLMLTHRIRIDYRHKHGGDIHFWFAIARSFARKKHPILLCTRDSRKPVQPSELSVEYINTDKIENYYLIVDIDCNTR